MDIAKVSVRVSAEGVDQTAQKLDGLGTKIEGIGSKLTGVGQKMSLAVTTPLLLFGANAFHQAANVQEAMSKVDAVFGDSAGVIQEFGATAIDTMNATQYTVLAAAGDFGNLFTALDIGSSGVALDFDTMAAGITGVGESMAQTNDPAADMSIAFTGLARDMESFHNVPMEEALTAIRAGLVGEAEPMRKFGVMLSEAAVQAKAAELGFGAMGEELTEQEKIMARAAIIMEQTTNAHGDAGRTADSAANQFREFKNRMTEFSAALGTAVLPTFTAFFAKLADGLKFLQNLSPTFLKIVAVVGVVAAAMGPLLIVFGTLISSIGAITGALAGGGILAGFGALLGPIALVVAALVALGIAYKTNFLGFATAVNWAAGQVKAGFVKIAGFVSGALKPAIAWIQKFIMAFKIISKSTNPVSAALETLAFMLNGLGIDTTTGFAAELADHLRDLADSFEIVLNKVRLAATLFRVLRDQGVSPVDAAIRALSFLLPDMGGLFDEIVAYVMAVVNVFTTLIDVVQAVVAGFQEGGLRGAIDALLDGLPQLGAAILDVYATLLQLVMAVGELLVDALRSVDWGALLEGAAGLAGRAIAMMGDLAVALTNWVVNAVQNIDWAAAWSWITSQVSAVMEKLGTWGSEILDWISEAMPTSEELKTLWDVASGMTAVVIEKFGTWGSEILDWVTDAMPTTEELKALWDVAVDMIPVIIEKFGTWGTEILDWVAGAMPTSDELKALWDVASGMAATVVEKFGEWGTEIADWIMGAVPSAEELGGFGSLVGSAIWTAIKTGVDFYVNTFGVFLKDAIVKGINLIVGLAGDFLPMAMSIGDAIWNAITTWVGAAATRLIDGIKGKIVDAINGINAIVGDFTDLAGSVADAVWGIIKSTINEVSVPSKSDIWGHIKEAINSIVAAAGDFVSMAASIGGAIWADLMQWLKDNITADAIKDFVVGNTFGRLRLKSIGGLPGKEDLAGAGGGTAAAKAMAPPPPPDYSGLINAANAARQAVEAAFVNMQINVARIVGNTAISAINAFRPIQQGLTNTANATRQAVEAAFINMQMRVQSTFSSMSSSVRSQMTSLSSQVSTQFQQMQTRASTSASSMATQVRSSFQQMQSSASQSMSQIVSAISSGFSQAVSRAQSAMSSIRSAISSLGNQYSAGLNIGSSLGQGIYAGINSWAGRIANEAARVVNAAITAARNAAASASPSKKMIALGQDMMQGGIIGLQRLGDQFIDTAHNIVAASVPPPPAIDFGTVSRAGRSGGDTIVLSVDANQYQELLEMASRGGTFAREMVYESRSRYRRVVL